MKLIDRLLAWVLIVLGITHSAFGMVDLLRSGLRTGLVWFLGAGLALIFAGMLNLLRMKHGSGEARLYSGIGSVLVVLLAIVAALAFDIRGNPQIVVLLAAAGMEAVFSARQ